ncbi:TolC family protein [Photobacterium minamisatsumaniensis]|uniref:TolC family protein n=1 Tax=Photobacterium minamisatsumaniensis TaxID=2910233 RepID=UPI003D14D9BA
MKLLLLLFFIIGGCVSVDDTDLTHQTMKILRPYDEREMIIYEWWEGFKNEDLNILIDKVREYNREIKSSTVAYEIALLNISENELSYGVSSNIDINSSVSKELDKNSKFMESNSFSISSSYAFDLYGKFKNRIKVSEYDAEIIGQNSRTLEIMSISKSVSLYFDLLSINHSIELYLEEQKFLIARMKIIEVSIQHGVVLPLEEKKVTNMIAAIDSKLFTLKMQKSKTISDLTLLSGEKFVSSSVVKKKSMELINWPSLIRPVGYKFIASRPDIIQAELKVYQQFYLSEIENINYYPDLNVNLASSSGRNYFSDILMNPVGILSASLSFPFLNWNKLEVRRVIQDKKLYSSIVEFEESMNVALNEVNVSFLEVQNSIKKIKLFERELKLEFDRLELYKVQADFGTITKLQLMEAKQTLLHKRIAQLDVLSDYRSSIISFCNATATHGCSPNVSILM